MNLEILGRLESLENPTGLAIDSFSKSLRAYETRLHPLLKERLIMLGDAQDDISAVTSTTSYSYASTDEGFTGASLTNFVLQPMFDQEEPEFDDIIYLKCSTKTIGPKVYGKRTMEDILRHELMKSSDPQKEPTTLRELCERQLGHYVTADLLQDNYLQSGLAKSINSFLAHHDNRFPAATFLEVPGRSIPLELEMDSKFYPTRNDDRAYCKDRNLLRHLTGVCLHKLFLPQDKSLRANLYRNSVLPDKGKDTLNVSIPRLKNRRACIALTDISNFTGSNGNSWALLHVIALQLSQGGIWSKQPNLYCVAGSFFSATWRDIIIVYLYHTVGIPCAIPGGGVGYLPGGFLGVAANITVGLVMLAVVLENLKRILRRSLDYVYLQAGGDDTFIALVGEEDAVEEGLLTTKSTLRDYVGWLKAFDVINLDERKPGLLQGHFCKKMLWLEVYEEHYVVRTIPSIPLPECLSTGGYLKAIADQEKAWRTFHLDLKRFEVACPGSERTADTLRERFLQIYPACRPARFEVNLKRFTPSTRWEVISGKRFTQQAYNQIASYADVSHQGKLYLDDFQGRVRHSLCLGHNLSIIALFGGRDLELIVKRGQKIPVERETITEFVGMIPDNELLARINDIYKK